MRVLRQRCKIHTLIDAHMWLRCREVPLASENELRQKSIERGLFERFCGIKPFEIAEATLTQPPPPGPDFSVDVIGDGIVGFELVSIDEVSHIHGLILMPKSAKLIAEFHAQLPTERRIAFDERNGTRATLG
jgi:hypothetical protein